MRRRPQAAVGIRFASHKLRQPRCGCCSQNTVAVRLERRPAGTTQIDHGLHSTGTWLELNLLPPSSCCTFRLPLWHWRSSAIGGCLCAASDEFLSVDHAPSVGVGDRHLVQDLSVDHLPLSHEDFFGSGFAVCARLSDGNALHRNACWCLVFGSSTLRAR